MTEELAVGLLWIEFKVELVPTLLVSGVASMLPALPAFSADPT